MNYTSPSKQFLENLDLDAMVIILYSVWDIQQALSSLTFLLEECDFDKTYPRVYLRKFRSYEANVVMSFTRLFSNSRSFRTLSLKKIGIRLNEDERKLKNNLMQLRNKIIAHSDEDYMHFKSSAIKMFKNENIYMPCIQYDEGLNLNYEDLIALEIFFHALLNCIGKFIFEISQKKPEIINVYKRPHERD